MTSEQIIAQSLEASEEDILNLLDHLDDFTDTEETPMPAPLFTGGWADDLNDEIPF